MTSGGRTPTQSLREYCISDYNNCKLAFANNSDGRRSVGLGRITALASQYRPKTLAHHASTQSERVDVYTRN